MSGESSQMERTIKIEFSNRLSIPVEIPSCQLLLDKSRTMEIEAPPLSFTIPPKHKSYAVYFPFIVISTNRKSTVEGIQKEALDFSSRTDNRSFRVIGLRIACFNRNISIQFEKTDKSGNCSESKADDKFEQRQVPCAVTAWQRNCSKKVSDRLSVRLETVPAQPNLLVSFSTSPTPLEDSTMVPVHLSDGEIYTIPSFRLENDFGPSGLGKMERLQIVGVGLPGLPEDILFDNGSGTEKFFL